VSSTSGDMVRPCERFPHMVELYQKYGKDGKIRFVSMSLDDPSDGPALQHAEEFLVKQNAVFDDFRMDEIIPDAFENSPSLGFLQSSSMTDRANCAIA